MIGLDGNLALSAVDKKRLQNPLVGGVILFTRNFSDGRQLRQLCAEMRRHAGRELTIAADQEGGRVQRFSGKGWTTLPSMGDIGELIELIDISEQSNWQQAKDLAEATGLVLAAELMSHGVDLSFTPVLDIDHGRCAVIGKRAFSAAPSVVSVLALALVAGLRRAGIASCAKHFPGHGYVQGDSHDCLPVDERPLSDLLAADLCPFQDYIKAGGELIMTAHVVYREVDSHAATFSATWLKTILREQLGYSGLVVCDDLSMQGAKLGGTLGELLPQAVEAGCDLFLACQPPDIDEVIATLTKVAADKTAGVADEVTENPPSPPNWQRYRQRGQRIGVGDAVYQQARDKVQRFIACRGDKK